MNKRNIRNHKLLPVGSECACKLFGMLIFIVSCVFFCLVVSACSRLSLCSRGNHRSPSRLLSYGPRPKTDEQSCQKSLLFLCMTRMTPPPPAPSASRQAVISPLAFLRLPCLKSSNPPPRPPPSWVLRLRSPQTLSNRALIGTML